MANYPGSPAFDPICGMWLEPDQIAVTYTYLGQTYGFCCNECCEIFARVPEAHIVRLAHEPTNSAGHRCPFQRPANRDSDGGTESKDPER